MNPTLTRSTLLKAGGALLVSVVTPLAGVPAEAASPGRPDPAQLDSWLAVGRDGTVTAFTGRVDFGQRKRTSFAQIVAEELDVPFSSVVMVMGDTSRTVDQGPSNASDGIIYGARPLRHAAAEARRVLLGLAAKQLGVPVGQLRVSAGVVSVDGDPSRRVAYGTLIGDQRFNVVLKVSGEDTIALDVAGQAQPKDPRDYTLVGKSIPAAEIAEIVTGTWPRVHNVRLPGMLHARLVLPPGPGARVLSVHGLRTPVPGVRVVSKGDFVAVVATTEWAAIRGADAVDVRWTAPHIAATNETAYDYLRSAPAQAAFPPRVRKTGDVDAALPGAAVHVAADYRYPVQGHGMIGPSCGVADVRGDQATVYAGTQDPGETRAAVARLLNLPEQSVRLIPVEPSGCYGRLNIDDATLAAAYLSQRMRRPVRVQLMRGQEQAWDPFMPPSTFTLRAGVDATGKVVAWDQQEWSWSWVENELPLMLLARGTVDGTAPALFRPPGGGDASPYAFDNFRMTGHTVAPLLRGTQMRSPGRIQACFATEQFVDEIAAAVKQDPVAFRLRHMTDPRAIRVVNAAAKLAGWEPRPSPGPDARSSARIARGRGIALVANQKGTYIATVAQVEVDRRTGNVRVVKMSVAADPGLVVNPDGLRSQIEGATIFATSRALKEEVAYDRTSVKAADWLTYPILRFTETPDLEIAVIDDPALPSGGIGEAPNTPPPAAIGNAIYDATGVRVREVPYAPARVKAALAAG